MAAHVNTIPAVRVLHIFQCALLWNVRMSVHSTKKNKAKAMSVLASRIVQAEQERQAAEQTDTCAVTSIRVHRSDKIPGTWQLSARSSNRSPHHNLTILDEVMNGKIDELIQPIITEYQADQLAALSEQN